MALGRGLSSLIPSGRIIRENNQEIFVDTGEQVLQIPLDQVQPNPEQPRKNFSRLEMEELINSIKEYGIIQPLILTRLDNREYQIVAGERRWRAAKFLEFKTIPALVRSIKENEKLAISLLENIQRKDLNPMEKAKGYQRMIEEFDLTQEQVAKKMGKARASIANTLRILNLPEEIKKAIEEEKIGEGHAKALLSAENEEKQKILLKRIIGLGLTVKETENLLTRKRIRKTVNLSQDLLEKENLFSQILGTKVKIIKQNKKIKVVIELYQEKELENLINKLQK